MKAPFVYGALLVVLLVLRAASAQAQMPSYAPPRMAPPPMPGQPGGLPMHYSYASQPAYQEGSYQLADGQWRPGRLLAKPSQLLVRPVAKRSKETTAYHATEVQRFVVARDTLCVAHEVVLPQNTQPLKALFVKQVYCRGGYRLMAYSWPALFGGGMRERMIVGVPGHPDLLLSTGRKKFQQEMLTIVGDDPVLARQLQQDELGPDMAQPLFESYVRQKMQGTPTASVTNGQ